MLGRVTAGPRRAAVGWPQPQRLPRWQVCSYGKAEGVETFYLVPKVKGKQLSRLADRAWTRRKLAAGEPGIAPCSAESAEGVGGSPGQVCGDLQPAQAGTAATVGALGIFVQARVAHSKCSERCAHVCRFLQALVPPRRATHPWQTRPY